jgi:hypothetical protein
MGFLTATAGRAVLLLAVALSMAAPALAGDGADDEPLKQCARDLCQTIGEPPKDSGELACNLSKTWKGEEINKAAAQKKLSWTYGDPTCNLDLKVERAILVAAAGSDTYTLKVPSHKVSCEVEQNGTKQPVNITLAPEVKLKKGEATTVLLKVSHIEGPKLIKAMIWSTAKLEDTVGIFHSDMVKGINTFIKTECPKVMKAQQ